MMDVSRINQILRAVANDVPADIICETDEEYKTYHSAMREKNGWMKQAGIGINMVNEAD